MRVLSLALVVSVLAACESEERRVVETTATVTFTEIEGGIWYLLAGDDAYVPSQMPAAFKVSGLAVQARVRVRHVATSYQFGTPVELLSIAPLNGASCEGVGCAPCPPPWAKVMVWDAGTGGPVEGASVTGGGVIWTCAAEVGKTKCSHEGYLTAQPDLYTAWAPVALVVSAPGYVSATTQVTSLPPGPTPPGQCCSGCWTFQAAPVALVRQ